uniref:Ig-like domain-containing protein n=1 Tax=Anabas testudineus TaxID=64144 RepID=A0A3Q1J6M8_ANATE
LHVVKFMYLLLSWFMKGSKHSHWDLFPLLPPGSVSTPSIEVISDIGGRLVLQCESKGWYPEPELLWLDAEGKILSAGPTETVRGPDDLYTVSSRVTVEKRHSNNIICRVQQSNINQTRETRIVVKCKNNKYNVLLSYRLRELVTNCDLNFSNFTNMNMIFLS